MSRTIRNESGIMADLRRYAHVTGRRARKKRDAMITRRVNARVSRIAEVRALAIADRETADAKPTLSWYETWHQMKGSFF